MDITYLGHASFFIKTKPATILTDPFDPKMVGLPFPKKQADIVTISHEHADHNYRADLGENTFILDWPGEYEKNSVRIFGFSTFHDKEKGAKRGTNTMFKFEVEDLAVLHCGDLGHILEDQLVEEIGDVDALMIPTGGFYTIDAKDAAKVVKEIDPAIVIPMHYNHEKLNQETFSQLSPVSAFIEELGEEVEYVDTLSIRKIDINPEATRLVVFKL
ncbi:MBL fold metallo-hydrolase [Candidatus Woesebacteria bacterium]|nr:MBL fold metallo-hydrolase [Candidatus Woesebacteria bacterium]